MKIASSSGSPTDRRSCFCVPSPQSNRICSPPARSRIAGSPRRAVGTEPAVPAKKSDRSTRLTVVAELLELDELEGHPPGGHVGDPHGVAGGGGAPRGGGGGGGSENAPRAAEPGGGGGR